MRWSLFILFFLLFGSWNCKDNKAQKALQEKESALDKKETELLEKETALQLKEKELRQREIRLDSTIRTDSSKVVNNALPGLWEVKMTCTETTCAVSAVGDTKTEQWEISYQNTSLLVRALSNGNLVRLYSGFFDGTTVQLAAMPMDSLQAPISMNVRLQLTGETALTGQREILRDNNCRVVYTLQMNKQS